MRRTYLLWHWFLTLIIAPFTSQLIEYIFGRDPHKVVGLLEVFPLVFLVSVLLSLPTFLIYCACFYFLSKGDVRPLKSKIILIAVSVAGICTTQSLIKGSMSQDIIIAYSVTAIIVGIVLRLKKSNEKSQI